MKKIFISAAAFLLLILPVVAKCAYCGQPAYGRNCVYAPFNHLHVHASGGDKCIYCGSTSLGKNCVYSPDGVHER